MTELEKQAEELYSFPEARKAYIKGHQDDNKWISVSERTPNDNTKVLALTKFGEIVLLFKDSKWYTVDILTQINGEYKSMQLFVDVSHWMPLP
jgi:hypothetical protein